MQWYYLDANKRQLPFEQDDLQGLISGGVIHQKTLVWNGSMIEWHPASSVLAQWFHDSPDPSQSKSPAPTPPDPSRTAHPKKLNEDLRELVKDVASFLSARAKWMKFFAVILIIAGIPNLIILIGGLYIWLGVMLWKSATLAQLAEKTGTREALEGSLFQLGRFFKVNGILMLVVLILYIAAIVFAIATGVLAPLIDGVSGGGSGGGSPFESVPDKILDN